VARGGQPLRLGTLTFTKKRPALGNHVDPSHPLSCAGLSHARLLFSTRLFDPSRATATFYLPPRSPPQQPHPPKKPPPIPRSFKGTGSDSDSSESEDEVLSEEEEERSEAEEESSEEDSDVEEDEDESEDEEAGGKTGASAFLKDVSESEESEDEEKVTVVKSAKDKRLEELENTVRLIENAEKIGDWAVISAGE